VNVTFKEGHRIAMFAAKKYHKKCPWLKVDDLYQEAWVGILSVKDKCNNGQNVNGFLYRTARNRIIGYVCSFRNTFSGGSFRALEIITLMQQEKAGKIDTLEAGQTPEDILSQKQKAQEAHEAIKKRCGFSTTKARLAALLISGEYKTRELAEILGVEVQSLYDLERKAKSKIKTSKVLKGIYGEQ